MTHHRQRGRAVLKSIGLGFGLIAVALAGWFGYAEYRRNYWDSKVREMCANDGGLRVLEEITLSHSAYQMLLSHFGDLSPPSSMDSSSTQAPIVEAFTKTVLRQSNPEVRRYEQRLIRKRDGTVLGTFTTYSRVGGDPGFVDNPSSFSCPENSGNWFSKVIHKQEG